MIDYFKLYEVILRAIRDQQPKQVQELFQVLSEESFIQQVLQEAGEKKLVDASLEVIDNLIDDELLVGKKSQTKDGPVYLFDRLSTLGHQYLQVLEKPSLKKKLRAALKEEGIPLTPQSLSKVITKIIL